jgi:hypothetical protein
MSLREGRVERGGRWGGAKGAPPKQREAPDGSGQEGLHRIKEGCRWGGARRQSTASAGAGGKQQGGSFDELAFQTSLWFQPV